MFREGKSLEKNYSLPLTKDRVVEDVSTLIKPSCDENGKQELMDIDPETIKLLDETEFADYLGCSGDWQHQTENIAPAKNEILGDIVSGLLALSTAKPTPKIVKPQLNSPLNVIIIGKPYSGKDTLATRLAIEHNLKKIRISDLINNAIE